MCRCIGKQTRNSSLQRTALRATADAECSVFQLSMIKPVITKFTVKFIGELCEVLYWSGIAFVVYVALTQLD